MYVQLYLLHLDSAQRNLSRYVQLYLLQLDSAQCNLSRYVQLYLLHLDSQYVQYVPDKEYFFLAMEEKKIFV